MFMRTTITGLLGIAFVLAMAGCGVPPPNSSPAKPTYSLCFYDKQGNPIAEGTMTLDEPLPQEGEISGTEEGRRFATLLKDYQTFLEPRLLRAIEMRTGQKPPAGRMTWKCSRTPSLLDESRYAGNFMPDVSDANITAVANPSEARSLKGRWWYELMAGGFVGGSFTAVIK